MSYKPTLCFDFDGVLHSHMSKWTDAAEVLDGPVPGAQEFVKRAMMSFNVVVLSSRSHQPGGIEAMREWMQKHGFPEVDFPREKPAAHITIDDRAIQFTGEWPSIGYMLDFKPWNKRGK